MNNFEEKEFKEVPNGKYDQNGFYYTPDGSFWDPDGVYFNSEGFDKHRGYYDSNIEYIPGPGWIEELMCYEDEKETILKNKKITNPRIKGGFDEEEDDGFEELDEIFDDRDYDKILKEEEVRNVYKPMAVNTVSSEKVENISPDKLFNKIPEEKKPVEQKEKENVRKEKVVEVDSLFG
jgi:hypothetical protein